MIKTVRITVFITTGPVAVPLPYNVTGTCAETATALWAVAKGGIPPPIRLKRRGGENGAQHDTRPKFWCQNLKIEA